MGKAYDELKARLRAKPERWLVTGVAGFIGSHLAEELLKLGQTVTGLDNFETGYRHNLEDVRRRVGETAWARFTLVEGDITVPADCARACQGVDRVLHQAALGSVPRSITDPLHTHANNVTGMVHMLLAARDAKVRRFVYASSSSVYGENAPLPNQEDHIRRAISPYAVSKYADELYAGIFGQCYGLESIGLRYFNVFGPRQDPKGAYAAVIPSWMGRLLSGQRCEVFGDGTTTRDFTYVANVAQANLLAATTADAQAIGQVYNVACGASVTLRELYTAIRDALARHRPEVARWEATYKEFRSGDVLHSRADVSKAGRLLRYEPTHSLPEGLQETVDWYAAQAAGR